MKNKKLLLIAFALLALLQLFVPANMILHREDVLATGTEYKFLTAPVDPNDPFRGKYIVLNFAGTTVFRAEGEEWLRDDPAYVTLTTGSDGFVKIAALLREAPGDNVDYVEASASGGANASVTIDFPFDRFYMEESKAKEAENIYRKMQRDTSQRTYALVNVKEGAAVLKDVVINGVSIQSVVEAARKQE